MAPKLTQKQEAFCLAYLETGNASEAYRRAYKPQKSKSTTINRNAKALLDDPKIAARVQELRAPAVERARLTLEQHLENLRSLRDGAVSEGNYGAAVSAEVARGKASGLHVEKVEVTAKLTLEQLVAESMKKPEAQ